MQLRLGIHHSIALVYGVGVKVLQFSITKLFCQNVQRLVLFWKTFIIRLGQRNKKT